jgi:hypothetical protein
VGDKPAGIRGYTENHGDSSSRRFRRLTSHIFMSSVASCSRSISAPSSARRSSSADRCPARVLGVSVLHIRLDNNKSGIDKSQSMWTDSKMGTPGSFVNRRGIGKSQPVWTACKMAHASLSACSASFSSRCRLCIVSSLAAASCSAVLMAASRSRTPFSSAETCGIYHDKHKI